MDSLGTYLHEIGRVPLLTTTQEIQLGRQIQAMQALEAEGRTDLSRDEQRIMRNGKRAMDKMIKSNLRLVVTIARKYHYVCQTLELADVISLGNIGLATAARKFRPELGYKFSTYAYWWIRQSITRGINNEDRLIRLPVHQFERIGKIRNLRMKHPGMTIDEAAAKLKISIHDLRPALLAWTLASLDKEAVEDGTTIGSTVSDVTQCPDDELLRTTANEEVQMALSALKPEDRNVIEWRFGFKGQMALSEIGKRTGVCRERVRQREKRALLRLRSLLQVAG